MLTGGQPTSVAHQYNVIMVVSPSFKLAMLVSDGNNSELSPGAISFENTLEASKSPTFLLKILLLKSILQRHRGLEVQLHLVSRHHQ